MAKYHYNIYPVSDLSFSRVFQFLKNFYKDVDFRTPRFLGKVCRRSELKALLKTLPENCTYMVERSFDSSYGFPRPSYVVWFLPSSYSLVVIEQLINDSLIDMQYLRRDVGFYELTDVLNDLPRKYHYIAQRYYE